MCEQPLREGLQGAQLRPPHISKSNATFQGEKQKIHTSGCCFLVENHIALSVGFAFVCLILAKFFKINLYH